MHLDYCLKYHGCFVSKLVLVTLPDIACGQEICRIKVHIVN